MLAAVMDFENIKWERCGKCNEHVPAGQLIYEPDSGKYICDVCMYDHYMKGIKNVGTEES